MRKKLYAVAVTLITACGFSCAPAQSRATYTPGRSDASSIATPGSRRVIRITPPPRVYVPTEAEGGGE